MVTEKGSRKAAAVHMGVALSTLNKHMKRGPNWKREVYVPIVDPITRKFISAAVYEANKLEAERERERDGERERERDRERERRR
jgi:hypothetical protein